MRRKVRDYYLQHEDAAKDDTTAGSVHHSRIQNEYSRNDEFDASPGLKATENNSFPFNEFNSIFIILSPNGTCLGCNRMKTMEGGSDAEPFIGSYLWRLFGKQTVMDETA
jgi:hypothetical protein